MPGGSRHDRRRGPRVPRASRAFHLIAKPVGPLCNLDCGYCFYLEKRGLFPAGHRFRMSDDCLERLVVQYIGAQPLGTPQVSFAFQGGEPTLVGLPFFRRVVELQAKHARPGMRIVNALQTNATLLDDQWGRFLHEHDFLVGVSIDGPAARHDSYRRDKYGRGTFRDVRHGIDVLRRHAVEFNTLTAVHAGNADDPAGLYDFLKSIGSTFLQFIPIVVHASLPGAGHVERAIRPAGTGQLAGVVDACSVRPEHWGAFLNGVFDRWLECSDLGRISVQLFDTMLGLAAGGPSMLCVHAETCGTGVAMEHNGAVYSCDHYVSPEFALGNVHQDTLAAMMDGARQRRFGTAKRDTLPRQCRECRFIRYCGGGCPKDRIATSRDGEPGLAFLCEGYRAFYAHTLATFRSMTTRLPRTGLVANGPHAPGRNAPCPCGSGTKYKRCCGSAASTPA